MQVVNFIVSFLVITVLFALIFKYVPDVKIRWRDVWLGAVVTALLFTLGKFAIGLYLGNGSSLEQFGAAGSLVVILLWVYYSAQIVFFGAEFTQVVANQHGHRVAPAENAVPLTEQERLQQGMPHQEDLAAAAVRDEPVERQARPGPGSSSLGSSLPGTPAYQAEVPLSPAPAGGSLPLFASLVGALIASVGAYIALLSSRSRGK